MCASVHRVLHELRCVADSRDRHALRSPERHMTPGLTPTALPPPVQHCETLVPVMTLLGLFKPELAPSAQPDSEGEWSR